MVLGPELGNWLSLFLHFCQQSSQLLWLSLVLLYHQFVQFVSGFEYSLGGPAQLFLYDFLSEQFLWDLKIPIISSEHEQRIPPLPTYWTKFYLRMSWNGKKCNKKIMQPLVFHQNCILPKNVMKYREMQQKKSSNLSFSWKKLFTLNCHEIVKNAIEKSHNLSSGKKNTIDCLEMVRNAIKKSHNLSPNFFLANFVINKPQIGIF